MAAKPKNVDWEAVELDVRAGILTFVQMGEKHGLSPGRIAQVKKEKGWTRDLSAKIKARTAEKLNAAALNGKLNASKKAASEEAMIEAKSNLQADTLLAHQKDARQSRVTVSAMIKELGAAGAGEIQAALEIVRDKKCANKSTAYQNAMNKAFDAAVSLGGRSTTARNLVASQATAIDKERQAFGIDKASDYRPSLGEWLAEV